MIDFKKLEKVAFERGFSRVGVSFPEVESFFVEKLKYWIEKGYHKGLEWYKRGLGSRINPLSVLPWAKAVVVFVDNYFYSAANTFCSGSEKIYPMVSKYATGVDYHGFIRKRIKQALKLIQKEVPELQWKVCVDTCPFLEKVYAVQAGLGWYGKNSLVIFPGLGSFCFIGIAFLNQEVSGYKRPQVLDGCKDCDKCIRACPGGAIAEPYFLDVDRCVSFLTVEKKGAFSVREKELVARAGYIFGCDICQDACPWNKRHLKETHNKEYYENVELVCKDLKEWSELSNDEISTLLQKSVLKRAGLEGLKRNIEALKG
ncbi:MAG: tRNA epoxyqueuosine(34) reductase QueG [Candidatus Marinimicrobia bacterium]|nr:tRNA epoxyqueuosine(34) reductase QueG [Candidatus Neomarinimicrobiota bacterium]